jgi:hypothetical protein
MAASVIRRIYLSSLILAVSGLFVLPAVSFGQTTNGLIGYWPLNNDGIDRSTNQNPPMPFDSAYLVPNQTDSYAMNTFFPVESGGPVYCGVRGYFDQYSPTIPFTFTICFWLNNFTPFQSGPILTVGAQVPASWPYLFLSQAADGTLTGYQLTRTYKWPDSGWHHLALVSSNYTTFAYVDGVNVFNSGGDPYFPNTGTWPNITNFFRFGPSIWAVNAIRVYNRVLSSSEVQLIYAVESQPPASTYGPELLSIVPATNGMTLTCSSLVPGSSYTIQSSFLSPFHWSSLVSFTATNSTLSVTSRTNTATCFYRLRRN